MIRIGIFFGGSSREREISFLGGRTIYDRLDRNIFDPIPIFVDSFGNFIILNWQNIYKGTIKDFYPDPDFVSSRFRETDYVESLEGITKKELDKLIAKIGIKIESSEFKSLIDFAFLNLIGKNGEDGAIQGLLQWHNIPYSGTHILGNAININKSIAKQILSLSSNTAIYKNYAYVDYHTWKESNKQNLFNKLSEKLGLPFITKSAEQGSSIGVSIVKDFQNFEDNVDRCFFNKKIKNEFWTTLTDTKKKQFIINEIADLKKGLGFPLFIESDIIYSEKELKNYLNSYFNESHEAVILKSSIPENSVIFEPFVKGREFSCIVIEAYLGKESKIIVLPPTEIKTNVEIFDYRSKYLPGMVNKITPMDIDIATYKKIKHECKRIFQSLFCNVYARIDGFLLESGEIYISDPNTIPGMNTSSFLFNQAAELGFSPTDFLTFLIKNSLSYAYNNKKYLFDGGEKINNLNNKIKINFNDNNTKLKVGIILGGFSSEKHVSLESGRNIYDKLKSSKEYEPIPIFLSGNVQNHKLFMLPINILLKDNADDIHEICLNETQKSNDIVNHIIKSSQSHIKDFRKKGNLGIRKIQYSDLPNLVDCIFIALHGRPGEDGTIQSILESYNIPYNGSNVESSKITMNKYDTNTFLKSKGILTTNQKLILKSSWEDDKEEILENIQRSLKYPLIVKPVDEGCSTAVFKIDDEESLIKCLDSAFRINKKLDIESKIPKLDTILLEEFIEKNNASKLIEITVGFVTDIDDKNTIKYTIFEPSQVISKNNVLSLEEKFLAGEGQNITPAVFSTLRDINNEISEKIKSQILKIAQILNLEGYGRVDAFVKIYENYEIDLIIIEINSLPAMTPATCIFHQSALAGYKPFDFIDAIIKYGIKNSRINSKIYI